jgi:hypothetical protein
MFLVEKEDVITTNRMQKGDLVVTKNAKGRIVGAKETMRYVVQKLIADGYLDQHHEIYGIAFLELRHAFTAPFGTKSFCVTLDSLGLGVSVGHASDLYLRVVKDIGKNTVSIIDHALTDSIANVKKYKNQQYVDAFESLCKTMDYRRTEIRENSK